MVPDTDFFYYYYVFTAAFNLEHCFGGGVTLGLASPTGEYLAHFDDISPSPREARGV